MCAFCQLFGKNLHVNQEQQKMTYLERLMHERDRHMKRVEHIDHLLMMVHENPIIEEFISIHEKGEED